MAQSQRWYIACSHVYCRSEVHGRLKILIKIVVTEVDCSPSPAHAEVTHISLEVYSGEFGHVTFWEDKYISFSYLSPLKQKCHLEYTGGLWSTPKVDKPENAALAIEGLYVCVIIYSI